MPGIISTRYRNGKDTPGHEKQHCPWCCDQGLVPTGTERSASSYKGETHEAHVEQYGPCPHCEIGEAMEMSYWPRGFWQGRAIDIEKQCSCRDAPAPREQVRAAFDRAKEFLRTGILEPEADAPRIRRDPGQRLSPGGGGGSRIALPSRSQVPPDPAPESAPLPPRADIPIDLPPRPKPEPKPEPGDHRCSAHDGKNMPWPESTCESCHPAEEITL